MDSQRQGWYVAGFFLFYFLLLQFVSDLQYYLVFKEPLWDTIRYRLVTTPLMIGVYYGFYRLVIPLLLYQRYLRFALAGLFFLCFLEIYLHLLDWLVWHLPVLPSPTRANARQNWEQFRFPRQSLWLTLTHLVTLTGFAYFMHRRREERKLEELRAAHLRLELAYLKAQLHPHFFFNTLNNIYSLALERSAQTPVVVAQLSHLMRYIVYEASKPLVPLQREIDFIRDYVQLESIRHENNEGISFRWQGNPDGIDVPPLLFMPLAENGFKHGFTDPLQSSWLEAVLVVDAKEIVFEVKNSRSVRPGAPESGVGLENLQKRLLLLYPGRHRLEMRPENNAFTVTLTLAVC